MSNFAIVICLLIIATTSEAISLRRLRLTSSAEKLLNKQINSSRKEIEAAYEETKKVVDPSLSLAKRLILDLRDEMKNDEEKMNKKQTNCFQKVLDAVEDGRNKSRQIREWALTYLNDQKYAVERCKTTQPENIGGDLAASQCIYKIKKTLAGMVSTTKSQFLAVLQTVPKTAKEWAEFARRCEADNSAVMDGQNEPEAPQYSDD